MKTFEEWFQGKQGEPYNCMWEFAKEAWGASAENSAEEIERLRNAAPEVDQEPVAFRILRKNFDGEWVDDHRCWCNGKPDPNLIEDIAKRSDRWRIEYSYAIHPDAQAEIAKRDERIESLTAAGAEYQRQCFEQAARIKELEATCEEHRQYALDAYLDDEDSALAKLAIRNHEQAAEIARLKKAVSLNDETARHYLAGRTEALQEVERLKAVIGRCQPAFAKTIAALSDENPLCWRAVIQEANEALAAIKKEGL